MNLEGFVEISSVLRAGIYALGWRKEIVYIGKSKSMYSRIYSHRNKWNNDRRGKSEQTPWMPIKGILFDEVYIRPCRLEELDALEREMIALHKPKHNLVHKPREKTAIPVTLQVNGFTLVLNGYVKPALFERRI